MRSNYDPLLEYAHDDLLRLGADIEVLAPAELRERLAATSRAMAVRYSHHERT